MHIFQFTIDSPQVLADAGVEVAGRIVIVRYGRCFRGLKVKNAQDKGAVGVLIYSDPAEDGFKKGKVYPEGPWRPEFGVQRGSTAFMSLCTGDPARAASALSVKEVGGSLQTLGVLDSGVEGEGPIDRPPVRTPTCLHTYKRDPIPPEHFRS